MPRLARYLAMISIVPAMEDSSRRNVGSDISSVFLTRHMALFNGADNFVVAQEDHPDAGSSDA